MNTIGLTSALAVFFGIWFGHVAVRKIEFASPSLWLPTTAFLAGGLILEYCALVSISRSLSAGLGIVGITLLWDALELHRQQRRVSRGHAPSNPDNPRHARTLAQPGSHRVK